MTPTIVCRCGNIGCLEALAGGAALGRDGTQAARDGRSSELARLLAGQETIDAAAVGRAAAHGDAVSRELVAAAGRRIGRTVATLVNALNPSLVVIGGGVTGLGDPLIAAIRETVYARSAPLATRDLLIARSTLGDRGGRIGAASIVADELFSRAQIAPLVAGRVPGGSGQIGHIRTFLTSPSDVRGSARELLSTNAPDQAIDALADFRPWYARFCS